MSKLDFQKEKNKNIRIWMLISFVFTYFTGEYAITHIITSELSNSTVMSLVFSIICFISMIILTIKHNQNAKAMRSL